jgi:hypothetical protein
MIVDREESSLVERLGRPLDQLPPWLGSAVEDAAACAQDPTCPKFGCRHPDATRRTHVLAGPRPLFLCTRCFEDWCATGLVRPGPCLRCGKARPAGTQMADVLVFDPAGRSGTASVWWQVCPDCRPAAEREVRAA